MAGARVDRRARHLVRALSRLGPGGRADLRRRLARAGLTPRAVCACFGVGSPIQAARAAAARPLPAPLPPAAVAPWLLAGGLAVPADRAARALAGGFDLLVDLGLVELDDDLARPCFRLLPVGEAIAIGRGEPGSGRLADDSSAHLIGALPTRRVDRWLDVGTGNGVAPLAARGLADRVTATDVDPTALALARAGALLSGADELALVACDLLTGIAGGWSLITFNAPIPAPGRATTDDLLDRFWREAGGLLAPGGEVIAHSVLPADGWPTTRDLAGSVAVARYTPPGATPAFGVTWWRPDGPTERRRTDVELTPARPHIARRELPIW